MKPSTMASKFRSACMILIWILLWQILYLKVGKEVLLPSPLHTLEELGNMLQKPKFYLQILYTLERVIIGVSLSLALGLLTAFLSYLSQLAEAFLKPAVTLMKSTPVMAIIILALLWFESNEVPIFVCFLMCYPIVYTNVLIGFKSLDKELIEMSKIFEVRGWLCIQKCYLPQLRPYLYAALDLSVSMAWKVVIAAEVLAVPKYAIGYALLDAKRYLETREVFAWIIVIVSLSEICQWSVSRFLKREVLKND